MSLFGRSRANQTMDGSSNGTQIATQSGDVIVHTDTEAFLKRLDAKDARIDELIREKDGLKDRVAELERQTLDKELAELRARKEEVAARKADPVKALAEHESRASTIEELLSDIATRQAIGENRIRSALQGFEDLEYEEIDALLEETEQRGITIAAKSAYAHGLVAEDAIRWNDAAEHYVRAALLDPTYDTLIKAGNMLWRAGRYGEAIRFEEDLVDFARREYGEEGPKTAVALNNLAESYRTTGRYEEAESLYREASEIGRKTLGEAHPYYATRLNNLANLLRATGRYEEAEPLYREALEITRKTLGEAHPDYANRLNNLAELMQVTGRSEEAEPLYREALEIDRKTLGEAHPNYAIGLNNLAELLQVTGRYEEAEPLYREALEIDRKVLGEAHSDYAIDLNNLAGLLRATGRSEEAEPLFREALAVFEAALGAEHPDTKVVRENLQIFLAEQRRG